MTVDEFSVDRALRFPNSEVSIYSYSIVLFGNMASGDPGAIVYFFKFLLLVLTIIVLFYFYSFTFRYRSLDSDYLHVIVGFIFDISRVSLFH